VKRAGEGGAQEAGRRAQARRLLGLATLLALASSVGVGVPTGRMQETGVQAAFGTWLQPVSAELQQSPKHCSTSRQSAPARNVLAPQPSPEHVVSHAAASRAWRQANSSGAAHSVHMQQPA